jgi:hypothetical protein
VIADELIDVLRRLPAADATRVAATAREHDARQHTQAEPLWWAGRTPGTNPDERSKQK